VYVGPGGIVGDEHDYTFHGGPDKAVHGCKKIQATIRVERYRTNHYKTALLTIEPGRKSSPAPPRGSGPAGSGRTSS
jgi:hypothetical protein